MQTYRESSRNYKYFFVHITFIKVGKCYNTVFLISITKPPKPSSENLHLQESMAKLWLQPGKLGFHPAPSSNQKQQLKSSRQWKRIKFTSLPLNFSYGIIPYSKTRLTKDLISRYRWLIFSSQVLLRSWQAGLATVPGGKWRLTKPPALFSLGNTTHCMVCVLQKSTFNSGQSSHLNWLYWAPPCSMFINFKRSRGADPSDKPCYENHTKGSFTSTLKPNLWKYWRTRDRFYGATGTPEHE